MLFVLFVVAIVSFHCWLKKHELEKHARKRDEWDDECNTNEQNTNSQSNSSLDKVQEWYNQVVKLWPASSPVQYHSMEDTSTTPVII